MRRGFLTKASSVFLAALMVVSCAACSGEQQVEETAAAAIKVAVQNPVVDYIEQRSAFTGKIVPDDSVSVFGKASGEVLKTYFEIGDTVEEGQLLFELDPADYQIALNQAKLNYEMTINNIDVAENGSGEALTELQYKTQLAQAENTYKTLRDVVETMADDDFNFAEFRRARKKLKDAEEKYDDNESDETWSAYSEALKEYDEFMDEYTTRASVLTYITQFEAAYDGYMHALESYEIYKSTQKGENSEKYDLTRQQAKLQYDSMLQTMDNLKVYAPISGVIEAKNVSANSMYANSMPGYVVSNKNMMVVKFSVSGDVANEMDIGDEIVVENGNQQYKAEITEIGTMVNEQNGLFSVEAALDTDGAMLSGVTVKLVAITAKGENSLIIPVSAIYYDDGDTYVYVEKDGVAVNTSVVVGIISGDNAEIIEGLSQSDKVITTWNPNLNDGVAVEVSEGV